MHSDNLLVATMNPATPRSLLEQIKSLDSLIQTPTKATSGLVEIQALRLVCFQSIFDLAQRPKSEVEVEAAYQLVEFYLKSGLMDRPISGELLAKANDTCSKGWIGLLSALILAPVWQLRDAPRIEDVPRRLWTLYTACALRMPALATVQGQADQQAGHYARRLCEIAKLAESNPGSSAVRGVLDCFRQAGDWTIICNSSGSLKEILSLRGRILAICHEVGHGGDVFILPREGRRLKVGFVLESLENNALARFALPWIEHLDDQRFETILFTLKPAISDLASHLIGKVAENRLIGEDNREALQSLRDGLLDVLVFFTRTTREADPVTGLAVQRSAPLQIVFDETGMTSGLPNSDLAIVEADVSNPSDAAHYTERLGIIPPNGVSLISNGARAASSVEWLREGVGIPESVTVYASVAPFRNLTPEWLGAVAGVLKGVPESRLVLYSYDADDASEVALGRVCSLVDSIMASHGIEPSRIILSNEAFPSEAEVIALLKIADLYLDTWPLSQREGALFALEAGVPVLTCQASPGHPRSTAIALSKLGLSVCIAENLDLFVNLAAALGTDSSRRSSLRDTLRNSLGKADTVFDPVTFGDAFGSLLECAFDRVASTGRPGLSTDERLISVPTDGDLDAEMEEARILLDSGLAPEAQARLGKVVARAPANPEVRALLRKLNTALGRHARAADSLLAEVERRSGEGELWFELGQALRASDRRNDALKAYEVALRLRPSNLEGWLVVAELASEAGNADMLREISTVAMQLAPDDFRCQALAARAGTAVFPAAIL